MTPHDELEEIFIKIGCGQPITDELDKRICELQDIINPPVTKVDTNDIGCGCGHPTYCWDCVAILGGCAEDV